MRIGALHLGRIGCCALFRKREGAHPQLLVTANLAKQAGDFLAGATMTTTVAVIVAAGRGTRAQGGGTAPKQYLHLAGEPVLSHSLRLLTGHPQIDAAVVVINPQDNDFYQSASAAYAGRLLPAVSGGATRQASVLAGLEALSGRGAGPRADPRRRSAISHGRPSSASSSPHSTPRRRHRRRTGQRHAETGSGGRHHRAHCGPCRPVAGSDTAGVSLRCHPRSPPPCRSRRGASISPTMPDWRNGRACRCASSPAAGAT